MSGEERREHYRALFARARKRDTLDIMVRGQVRRLGLEFEGQELYLEAAASCDSEEGRAMFTEACRRRDLIKEKEKPDARELFV